METTRRAVIDVGTNSVKLLVAEIVGRDVRPIREESVQTRLGQGFYETRRLRPEAIAATAEAAARFAAIARQCQAASTRIIATSAAREALNAGELTGAIKQASGLKVEIISGDDEALLGFKGVCTDPELARRPIMLLDVGGGSTQCILGHGEQIFFRQSFPAGTVRLMETLACSDPPRPEELHSCQGWLKEFLQRQVPAELGEAIRKTRPGAEESSGAEDALASQPARERAAGAQLVCVGGTASILGCMEAKLETFDRERLEAARLSAERVSWYLQRLWSLSLADRQKIVGLPSNRADVILMGVAIYEAVMEHLGFQELRISTRGLRFAALLNPAP